MTSKTFAQWVKEKRTKKKLSVKAFEKEFNQLYPRQRRSYTWFTALEKFGQFADGELEMLQAVAHFFGYRNTSWET